MDKKKIGAMALIVAIALSTFAIVYVAWRDVAKIDGIIEMGSVTPAFTIDEAPTCAEYYPNPSPPPDLLPGEYEGKDVGKCEATYTDLFTDVHSGKQGYRRLFIGIYNAYPQYYVHTTFIVHNIGTIPFFIYGLEMTGTKEDNDGNKVYDLLLDAWIGADGNIHGEIWEDVDGDGIINPDEDILVINVRVRDRQFPLQLDPCFSEKMEIDLDFKQAAQQCHHYYLHFSLLVIQWNKLYEVWP